MNYEARMATRSQRKEAGIIGDTRVTTLGDRLYANTKEPWEIVEFEPDPYRQQLLLNTPDRSPERIVAEHDNPLLEWAAAYAAGNEYIFVQNCHLLNIVPFWWEDPKVAYDLQRDPGICKPISFQLNRPAYMQSEREKNQHCWDKLKTPKCIEQEKPIDAAKHQKEQDDAIKEQVNAAALRRLLKAEEKAHREQERQELRRQAEAHRAVNLMRFLSGRPFLDVPEPASQKVG